MKNHRYSQLLNLLLPLPVFAAFFCLLLSTSLPPENPPLLLVSIESPASGSTVTNPFVINGSMSQDGKAVEIFRAYAVYTMEAFSTNGSVVTTNQTKIYYNFMETNTHLVRQFSIKIDIPGTFSNGTELTQVSFAFFGDQFTESASETNYLLNIIFTN